MKLINLADHCITQHNCQYNEKFYKQKNGGPGDIHNSYESETLVLSSRGLVKQYNQELYISPITRCFNYKRLQSIPLK